MPDSNALKAAFDKAMDDSKNLTERPDNATLLKIYALYKQGSMGDSGDKKPGFSDMVGRAKLILETAVDRLHPLVRPHGR